MFFRPEVSFTHLGFRTPFVVLTVLALDPGTCRRTVLLVDASLSVGTGLGLARGYTHRAFWVSRVARKASATRRISGLTATSTSNVSAHQTRATANFLIGR